LFLSLAHSAVKTCNKLIVDDPTKPQTRLNTALWNINIRKLALLFHKVVWRHIWSVVAVITLLQLYCRLPSVSVKELWNENQSVFDAVKKQESRTIAGRTARSRCKFCSWPHP